MLKKWLFIILWVGIVSSAPCLADPPAARHGEIPVNLHADDLHFDEESGMIYAQGNVRVIFEEVEIEANSLILDTATSIATAEGGVTIKRPNFQAQAEKVTYNSSSEVAEIKGYQAIASGPRVKGKLYLHCEKVYSKKEKREGVEGRGTSCEYEEPHYHVKAARVEYIPQERVAGWSVTFYLGKVPVFWVPYWEYNIKKRRVTLLPPVIGENEVEGRYVKSTVEYFVDDDTAGAVYLDWMEKKGWGKGMRHEYRLKGAGPGSFYIYNVVEKDTGIVDWVTKIRQKLKLSKELELDLAHDYSYIYRIPAGRADRTSSKVALSFNRGKRKVKTDFRLFDDRQSLLRGHSFALEHHFGDYHSQFSYHFEGSQGAVKWQRLRQRFGHHQPLFWPGTTLSTITDYYRYATAEGTVADERLEPTLTFKQRHSFYTLTVSGKWYLDLDGDTYTGDQNAEYVEKMPEIDLKFKQMDLAWVNLDLGLNYGKFHEAKYVLATSQIRHFTTQRYLVKAKLSKQIGLVSGTNLGLRVGLDQYFYDPGDAQYVFWDGATLASDYGNFFRNSLSYSRSQSDGSTPFFFDSKGNDFHTLKDTITLYHEDKIRFSVDGGYNYLTQKYFDLLAYLEGKPSKSLRFRLASGWSIENQRYRDLVSSALWKPLPKFSADLRSTYDLNGQGFKYASSIFDWEVGETWQSRTRFRIAHNYNFSSKQYIMQELMIVKDLHCWEATFSYSNAKKEYRLVFTLKAFPEYPVELVSGGRGIYFDNLFKQQTPPRD